MKTRTENVVLFLAANENGGVITVPVASEDPNISTQEQHTNRIQKRTRTNIQPLAIVGTTSSSQLAVQNRDSLDVGSIPLCL